MRKENSRLSVLLNGIIHENPVLVLLIGMCPSLAITTMAQNALGMGLATTFVLICSNVVISLLKKLIPDTVRLPAYIVVIAGFVTIMSFALKKISPELNKALGVYIELVVVNCIILMRAESFANKNGPIRSAIDGLGFGIGFTIALLLIGSVREILGLGTWFGMQVLPEAVDPMTVFVNPAGAFFALGIIIAAVNFISRKLKNTGRRDTSVKACSGCAACPSNGVCGHMEGGEE